MRRNKKGHKGRHKSRRGRLYLIVILLILAGGGIFMYTRPLPALYPINNIVPAQTSEVSISWPAASESAIGANGYGLLASNGTQVMKPTASTAKLLTVLTILNKYPLALGQQGPIITLSNADVNLYNAYLAENGSVVKVTAGEQISEYQMIQAILLPSANNMADSLAIWAFGSLTQYSVLASQMIQALGLNNTKVDGDASGFSPATESTSNDLVVLGLAAIKNPVIAQIVSQKQATIPVAGVIQNVNWLLGTDGIVGIKTGNTDQSGGVYVFAANDLLSLNHSVTIVGVIQGSPTLLDAINSAVPLIDSAKKNFQIVQTIQKSEVVAYYKAPWGQLVNAVAAQSNNAVVWMGLPTKPILALHAIYAPQNSETVVGSMTTANSGDTGSTNVVLDQNILAPPWWWRIIRHNL